MVQSHYFFKVLASFRDRNGCDWIQSLFIFHFLYTKRECVIQATVEWNDKRFKFIEQHSLLELTGSNVAYCLAQVYDKNSSLWSPSVGLYDQPGLNYPVSNNYLHKFGGSTCQTSNVWAVDSNHSYVRKLIVYIRKIWNPQRI